MPAKRIPVPPPLLSWYRVNRKSRGRDVFQMDTHISPHAMRGIEEDGTATPAVIAKIRRAMGQDEAYRRRVALNEVRAGFDAMYGDSAGRIYAMVGREAIDALAVRWGLLPERENPPRV
jgi:hypothetical protein